MRGLWAGIIAIAILLSLLGGAGHRATANGDGHDEEFEEMPRDVDVEVTEDEVEFRSSGAEGDSLRIRFRPEEGELRLEFLEPENATTEVQMKLTLEDLMEFVDEDGDGIFDVGERVIQTLEVREMLFELHPLERLENGYTITVEYFILETDLIFGLTFWIFGNTTLHEGVLIHPTEVKFDVSVSFFPFKEDLTSVALVVDTETEVEPRANFTGTEVELKAIGEKYEGFFRWSKTAFVDGEEVSVGSAIIEAETEFEDGISELEVERTVVLSYPQGEKILHDPLLGVAAIPILPPPPGGPDITEPIPQLNTFTYGVMLGIASLFVLATLLARGRRRS